MSASVELSIVEYVGHAATTRRVHFARLYIAAVFSYNNEGTKAQLRLSDGREYVVDDSYQSVVMKVFGE